MKRTWSTLLDQDGLDAIQKKYAGKSIRPEFKVDGTCHPLKGTTTTFVVLYEKPTLTRKHQDLDLSEQSLIEDLERRSLINQVFLNAQHIIRITETNHGSS